MAPSPTQSLGSRSEQRALRFLIENGLKPVAVNFRCRFGEIDLIMQDRIFAGSFPRMRTQSCLVFVEVRFRDANRFYAAAASVGPAKQRKLIRAASIFLGRNPQYSDSIVRFDVVAIDSVISQQSTLQWIKDAFRPGEQ